VSKTSDDLPYLKYVWAKSEPYQSLLHHMIAAGCMADALARSQTFKPVADKLCKALGVPPGAGQARVIGYKVSLHDIGKCFPDFQISGGPALAAPLIKAGLLFPKAPEWKDHAAAGAAWLSRDRRSSYLTNELGWCRDAAWLVSSCIRAHHGDFMARNDPEPDDLHASWEPLRRSLVSKLDMIFGAREWKLEVEPPGMSVAGMLLTGFIVLSDWLASGYMIPGPSKEPENFLDWARARATSIANSLFPVPNTRWQELVAFRDVFPGPGFEKPRPLQISCEVVADKEPGPCLAIIEAPMGEGKTEAAIYLATRWAALSGLTGMYFALPTTATSNQMHVRVGKFLAEHSDPAACQVALVHGMRWMVDRGTPAKLGSFKNREQAVLAHEWFRPSKRALLSAFGVGTIDQSLMAALKVKFGFLRVLGLANKVLIVDEVHAYDAYMSRILTLLLQWAAALGIPVILLSATLPASKKAELLDAYAPGAGRMLPPGADTYPVITLAGQNGIRVFPVDGCAQHARLTLDLLHGMLGNAAGLANLAVEASAKAGGKCVCVIVNTVRAAQDIYGEVKKACKDTDTKIMLFHARFPARRRRKIEKEVLRLFGKRGRNRPRRAILVATQVVEQSLDIDFDEMFSELAPVDLLLQRAGRMHRHSRPSRPEYDVARFHVVMPSKHDYKLGKGQVYDAYRLLLTCVALEGRDVVNLPEDIRALIALVYPPPGTPLPMHGPVPCDKLEAARCKHIEEETTDANEAGAFLIAGPDPRAFSLAEQNRDVFDDDEGETGSKSYLAAKTRLERYPMAQAIFIEKDEEDVLVNAVSSEIMPSKKVLRALLLRSAPVPLSWVFEVTPAKTYRKIDAIPWLRHHTVLLTTDGAWHGIIPDGTRVAIMNDPELGLYKITNNEHSRLD